MLDLFDFTLIFYNFQVVYINNNIYNNNNNNINNNNYNNKIYIYILNARFYICYMLYSIFWFFENATYSKVLVGVAGPGPSKSTPGYKKTNILTKCHVQGSILTNVHQNYGFKIELHIFPHILSMGFLLLD